MYKRVTVIAALLIVILPAPARAAAASTGDYVALGDSYSSGVGAPGQTGTCLRSPNAYPGLWAAANDPASYRSVACSGATTDDLRAFQLSALSAGTDLISVTIGGNDVGFAPTVITCTLVTDGGCAAKVNESLHYLRDEMPAKFDATFQAIRSRAPNARVVVLGYPVLFDETAASCGFAGMSIAKRKSLNEGARQFNAAIKSHAQAAGFLWSDVADDFAGHGVCGSSPWLNGLTALPPTNSFHPNASGYRLGYLPAFSGSAAG
ncbi:SGNH/GDSL hydrolase family protein [Actinoplanes sp. TFC3]|uniref:SGNH/GDSL hydrolase family protein n=1 Tax=Actinoplanes sp. TFC3 TaxID=1710355 RepID=UPI00082D1D97|nr:SGNH/GDSL hydrolase family protein [Actinoplanes sp. TFC3]